MTYPRTSGIFHYNQISFGPCHYFRSAHSGQRLLFRANEIIAVTPLHTGGAVVLVDGGGEFEVTSYTPEMVR